MSRKPADLDQANSFRKFNGILAFILPRSDNISATNGPMVAWL